MEAWREPEAAQVPSYTPGRGEEEARPRRVRTPAALEERERAVRERR